MGRRLLLEESMQMTLNGEKIYDGRNEIEHGDLGERREKELADGGTGKSSLRFFTDDQLIEETEETFESREEIHKETRELWKSDWQSERGRERESSERRPLHPHTLRELRREGREAEMAVDYSSADFRHSLAAIDAASREGVRVRQHGDTTVVTEHRDPYSFYWQLDQTRREESPPRRRPPPTEYVMDEEEVQEAVLSPQSHDSGVIVHESPYTRPTPLPRPPPPVDHPPKPLPAGWEKHEDPSGFSYYWHVDSGTIQRDPPRDPARPPSPAGPPIYAPTPNTSPPAPLAPAPPPQIIQLPPEQPVIEEHAFKQTTTKRRVENTNDEEFQTLLHPSSATSDKPLRFVVRSLGWTEVAEEDLTAESSSRAVNSAMAELSTARHLGDSVAKWGDGRELILELAGSQLSLLDPDSMALIHSENIHNIRVWGVGRENGRDLAYVSRDRSSRRFLCHVFRCDTPAKAIANALRDQCRRVLLERSASGGEWAAPPPRLSLPSLHSPPPDEPRKVVRCHFIGVTQVPRANGIDVLNDAVDRLVSQVGRDRWILCDVSIAPSTLVLSDVNGGPIATCRVRFLSFLGIGRDIKHCAFIMQVSSESFMCYVFHVEPSAATMAKTIEAACKLRYQKVLDAQMG